MKLSKFAETQPHAAYAGFTHGLTSKWNYLLRLIDWEAIQSDYILESLEKAIRSRFIPALTGQPPPGENVRELLALATRQTWWFGSHGPCCCSKRATGCHTDDQYPTCRANHQLGSTVGQLPCYSAKYQEENLLQQAHKAEGGCQKPPTPTPSPSPTFHLK